MSPDPRLTHLDADGQATMVDVTGKEETRRVAVAAGRIRMRPQTLEAFVEGRLEKGEAFAVARLAGIQAGKRTAELIPLCHALPGASVGVDIEPDPDLPGVRVQAEARYRGRTGLEMEALTALTVALLPLYDMAKAIDRGREVEGLRLLSKEGGASGTWRRKDAPAESG